MPAKKMPPLTEAELRLMKVLWEEDQATVSEVAAALPKGLDLAYNTILTTMRILESKGYVRHVKEGRAFVYRPAVDRGQATRSAVKQLLRRFFGDSPEALMLNILEDEALSEAELNKIRKLIEERKLR
ncbi:MAG TPA: BlaI/MecI/CopY family transcriptional regulator [Bryobacteraceae bacterium]|nr:BlaI/MecI/CopY family transcriptional regulator [Bryobacteraceae bacterium]